MVQILLDGVSMQPLIRRNRDYVTIAPCFRPVKRGDIVLFQSAAGRFAVHRLYKIKKKSVQTLGDYCNSPDAWISKDAVFGIILKVERGTRQIALDTSLARWLGRVWMTLLPIRRIYNLIKRSVRP